MRRRTKIRPIATENAPRRSHQRMVRPSRADKIYATKKWLIEKSAEEAGQRYDDQCHTHDAMQHLANAFAECAVSAHVSGGQIFAKTSDGMEWSLRYEQMGVRNTKTGRIDKRLKAKWPNDPSSATRPDGWRGAERKHGID